MRHVYKKTITLSLVALTGILSLNYSTGPAWNGQAVAGAPFPPINGQTCTSCHSPGTSYNATVNIELLTAALVPTVPANSYVAGGSYVLRITRSATGVPVTGGFGFQMTCATSPANTNVNTWGTPPLNTANRTLSSRNYIEHTQKLPLGTTQLNIPWTGPTTGTGSVKFYIALNTVNGINGNSGDQVVTQNITVTQTPLALSWLYFTGKEQNGDVSLEWAVAEEENNSFFTLEKSQDGTNFSTVTTIQSVKKADGESHYSYVDTDPYALTYYRVSQTDVNGNKSYFRTIEVRTAKESPAFHYLNNDQVVVRLNSATPAIASVSLHSIDGRIVKEHQVMLNLGTNNVQIEKPAVSGVYLISVNTPAGEAYSGKVLIP